MIPHAKGCEPSCMSDADGSSPNSPQVSLNPLAPLLRGQSFIIDPTGYVILEVCPAARQGLEQLHGNLEFMLDINDGRP